MAIRPFGFQTLTGSPQPAFGSKVATAFVVTPDAHTGNTDPRSQGSKSTIVVTAGTGTNFRAGDKIMVGPQAGPFDYGKVTAVATDTLTVQGLTASHATGEFVVLGIDAAEIFIQAVTNTLYIGTYQLTAATTSPYIYRALLAGQVYNPGSSNVGSVKGTSAYWVYGTGADTFLPGLDTV